VKKNDTVAGEYVYDGDSRRIQVTETNVTTTYIYSGLNTLYEEYIFWVKHTIRRKHE
jgi:hypothetical protein